MVLPRRPPGLFLLLLSVACANTNNPHMSFSQMAPQTGELHFLWITFRLEHSVAQVTSSSDGDLGSLHHKVVREI